MNETLQKIWHWIKVAALWIKGHIALIAFAIAMVFALVVAKNKSSLYAQLLEEFRNQQAQNTRNLDALRAVQADHITKQEAINKRYNEVLDHIQRDYQSQIQNLDVQKEKDLKHIIAVNQNDPNAMARDINILFGIPIYPPSNS
jgi:predicted solute-binding protein